ncbi:hypothetical protein T4B_4258 [Trichinella pseudospiralis]|uniref:Uncharacterized protein n=1 Tax=Trichinella pseudospiralis TaxID=6337 RepID=A0A0V1IU19_TRIPS|nr:hypothetical protein T4B_4258 [Trichinella pseudospiralis]
MSGRHVCTDQWPLEQDASFNLPSVRPPHASVNVATLFRLLLIALESLWKRKQASSHLGTQKHHMPPT